MRKTKHAVTGAFGFSGKYIAQQLLNAGAQVITLTNSPHRPNPFNGRIQAFPLAFDDPAGLAKSLQGVDVLYNTYWVRFDAADFSHQAAVQNTEILFAAAKRAGVNRIVHVSITNPERRPDLPYFAGKARLEQSLKGLGISYSILRPAVLFGPEDILINNIAWALRRFPIFAVFGRGDYRLQPIHVEDLARLAVEEGQRTENQVINAIGPESFTYRSLVQMLGEAIGKPRAVAGVPPRVGYLLGRIVGSWMKDRFITWEEVLGLMADLLYVEAAPPTGEISLSEWARANRETLGRRYAGEMARRLDRSLDYRSGEKQRVVVSPCSVP